MVSTGCKGLWDEAPRQIHRCFPDPEMKPDCRMSRCWPRSQQQTRTHRLHRRWKFGAASGWGSPRFLWYPGQPSIPGILACLASLQMPSTPHPLSQAQDQHQPLGSPCVSQKRCPFTWASEAAPMHSPARSSHEQWVQNRNSSRWQPCPTIVTDPHELLPPCPSPQPADPESHPPGRRDLSPGPLCQHPLLQCLFCPLHFHHLVLDRFLLQLWSWPWTRTDRLICTSGSRTEEGGGEWNAYSILRHFQEILHTHLYTHLFCCQNLTTRWPEFNYKASGYLPGNLENTVYSRRSSTWIKWEFQVWGLPICATLILVWRNKYTCDSFYLEDWTSGMKTKRIKMAVGECALVWIKPICNQSHKNPRWKRMRLPRWVQNLVLAWFYLPSSIVCRIVCPWLDVTLEKISAG